MSIALSLGNNLTTGGVFKASAVNNTSCNNITDFAGIAGGGTLILLSEQTASASASISFTTGIDSTYDEYIFKFYNIHTDTSSSYFSFNMSTDGGSNYNVTKTSTVFTADHNEGDTYTSLNYESSADLAQSTAYQPLPRESYNSTDADHGHSGYLHLFAPSSTTYVKHFIGCLNMHYASVFLMNAYVAGYGNTTSAINAIDFKMSTGTFDGIIKMYGVAKS
jgi:hypothetical protein